MSQLYSTPVKQLKVLIPMLRVSESITMNRHEYRYCRSTVKWRREPFCGKWACKCADTWKLKNGISSWTRLEHGSLYHSSPLMLHLDVKTGDVSIEKSYEVNGHKSEKVCKADLHVDGKPWWHQNPRLYSNFAIVARKMILISGFKKRKNHCRSR